MLSVVLTAENTVELNWVWLPTFVGMNSAIKEELRKLVMSMFAGKELTEDNLHDIHSCVVGYLCDKYPNIEGLDKYLDALSFVGVKL